jgi:hypothetical protein
MPWGFKVTSLSDPSDVRFVKRDDSSDFDPELWDVEVQETEPTMEDSTTACLDLEGWKDYMWGCVKKIRDDKDQSEAPTPFGPINIDEKSKTKIGNALNMCRLQEEFSQPFSINFKFADNVVRPLDNSGIRQVAAAAAAHVNAIFAHSFSLEQAINAATTVEEVKAVAIEEGWP